MKKSVLILHQDSRMAELIKKLILPEFSEFNIILAVNLKKFKNLVHKVQPAIIISDTLIHNICCLSLIKQTRKLLPKVFFIVFGDRRTTPCCQKCLIHGPDYFLDCPANFIAIFNLLKHLSAHPKAEPKQIKMPEISTCEIPRYLITQPNLRYKNKILG
jgi:DNA-binding NtrC family response regulator